MRGPALSRHILSIRLIQIDLKYFVSVVALSSLKKPEGFRSKIFHASAWSILANVQMVWSVWAIKCINNWFQAKLWTREISCDLWKKRGQLCNLSKPLMSTKGSGAASQIAPAPKFLFELRLHAKCPAAPAPWLLQKNIAAFLETVCYKVPTWWDNALSTKLSWATIGCFTEKSQKFVS